MGWDMYLHTLTQYLTPLTGRARRVRRGRGRNGVGKLAERAGMTITEVERLRRLGIVAPSDKGAFHPSDLSKLLLAKACEDAGLSMDGIASIIRAGRLSLAFLEAPPYRRWAAHSARSYRDVSVESGVPTSMLRSALEAMGFPPMASVDDRIREDELEVVPFLQLGFSNGVLDEAWATRLGRAHAEALRLIAAVDSEFYHARFEVPILESGVDQRQAMELAANGAAAYASLMDRLLIAVYRRQQEVVWMEQLVEQIESELEAAGYSIDPKRLPAMCFVDLVGYTRLTEERGDEAAAELAESLRGLVTRAAREHGGSPVKWLGDGVMVHFRNPRGAVEFALHAVARIPSSGLPPAHVGVAAGPVVAHGGDYFGRTVNLAARIAARAAASEVLVSESVVKTISPRGVMFVEVDEAELQGFAQPVRLFEARAATAAAT